MAKNKEKEPKRELNKEEEQPEFDHDFGEVFAAWEFLEYEKPERSRKWYLYFALIIALLIILSLFNFNVTLFKYGGQPFGLSFYQNPLFIVLLILFIIVYFYMERREDPKMAIAITEDGIVLHNRLIEYKDLENFYIIYYPPVIKNLYLQPKSRVRPLMTIPLEDQNPVLIREALLNFLQEDIDKEEEPTSDGLSRALKL